MNEEKAQCPNLSALKRSRVKVLMQERDYYVNVDLITIVEQSPQSPDRSSLRLVGSDHGIHIAESAENFLSRTGRA